MLTISGGNFLDMTTEEEMQVDGGVGCATLIVVVVVGGVVYYACVSAIDSMFQKIHKGFEPEVIGNLVYKPHRMR